ncbi:cell wall-binding repeat-containing protein [Peptostreptococcus anaerobius]
MKKQIAVLMAAATAVTTVAPAIANADVINHDKVSANEVNAEIKKALDTRYADPTEDGLDGAGKNAVKAYMNSRYEVILSTGKKQLNDDELEGYGLVKISDHVYNKVGAAVDNEYVVTDAEAVKPLIEKLMATPDKDKSVATKVYVVDKGIDGTSAYRKTKNKHLVKKADLKDADTEYAYEDLLADFKKLEAAGKAGKVSFVEKVEESTDELGESTGEFKVVLKSGEVLKFQINGDAVDIMDTRTKDDKNLDLKIDTNTLVVHNEQSVANQVAKFGPMANKDDVEVKVDVPFGDTDVYTVNDVELTPIDLGTVYTKAEGYTQAGADLINKLIVARRGDKKDHKAKFSFNHAGVNYVLANNKRKPVKSVDEARAAINTAEAKIDAVGDHYILRLNVTVLDKNDKDRFKTLQFKFEGKTQEDLARVLADLKGDTEVVVGKFTKLAGANRFETAIEVSKARFGYKEADTVVIVGANALMDGLSAAPLAAAKKAPVLLADSKAGLGRSTMDEIDRACKDLNRKTVYVVGGSNSVPQSVVKQLEDKFGAVVVRLSGDDRYDTSMEVASRLVTDKHVNTELFVVGGDGAADAMSISAVAAKKDADKKVSPILVVPQKGIKRTAREFIKAKEFETSYLIGGETTASTQVFRDLQETVKMNPSKNNVKTNTVKRLAGINRYATNVAVVKEFDMANLKGLDITSGDNKYLVDAQTAGAFAAENDAAILLTGSALTKDQKDLLKDMKLKTGVYQVGGVVSANVMKEVVDILGL